MINLSTAARALELAHLCARSGLEVIAMYSTTGRAYVQLHGALPADIARAFSGAHIETTPHVDEHVKHFAVVDGVEVMSLQVAPTVDLPADPDTGERGSPEPCPF